MKSELVNTVKVSSILAANSNAHVGPNVRILGTPTRLKLGEGCQIQDGALLDFRNGGELFLGRHVTIAAGAILNPFGGSIEINDYSGINHYTVLYGHGGLTIGKYVRIAARCLFIPANHGTTCSELPMCTQPLTKKGITIGDDIWIGAHCVILDGVKIGSGAVVAAGSVVSKCVEPKTIVGGVPARKIRTRLQSIEQ